MCIKIIDLINKAKTNLRNLLDNDFLTLPKRRSSFAIFEALPLKENFVLHLERSFPHSTSVRSNNNTRARVEWTFSYICCISVHPDSALLFAGMRLRSIYSVTASFHFFANKYVNQ